MPPSHYHRRRQNISQLRQFIHLRIYLSDIYITEKFLFTPYQEMSDYRFHSAVKEFWVSLELSHAKHYASLEAGLLLWDRAS